MQNPRLRAEVRQDQLLHAETPPDDAALLRAAAEREASTPNALALAPSELAQLAQQHGYDVQCQWSAGGLDLYDAVLTRREPPRQPTSLGDSQVAQDPTLISADFDDWSQWSNQPLADTAIQDRVTELRALLRDLLPDYMIPNAFVFLDHLPRSLQGKIDTDALPAPTDLRLGSEEYLAPRNDEERLIVDVWERLLGVRPVGVRDDFFELGGHSMLAVRVTG